MEVLTKEESKLKKIKIVNPLDKPQIIQNKETQQNLNEINCIQEKFKFYFMSFILGAYWNVKNIHKIGIL